MYSNLFNNAYKFAGHKKDSTSVAQAIYSEQPNILDLNDDSPVITEIKSAFQLRFTEWNPDTEGFYITKKGKLEKVSQAEYDKTEGVARHHIDVSYVMALSTQQITAMKSKDLAQYELVKPLREKCQNHIRSAKKDLFDAIKKLMPKDSETRVSKTYHEFAHDTIIAERKRLITAKSKGDITATPQFIDAWGGYLKQGEELLSKFGFKK
jgi:hypothetical protein